MSHVQPTNGRLNEPDPIPPKILRKSLKITLKNKQKSTKNNNFPYASHVQSEKKFQPSLKNHSQSKPLLLNRTSSSIKKDIDNRLHTIYSSIKSKQQKYVKTKQINLKEHLSGHSNHISNFRKSQANNQSQSSLLSSSVPINPFIAIENGKSEVSHKLPYHLLKEYINNIYREYNIEDPLLECQKPQISNDQQDTPKKSHTYHSKTQMSTKRKIQQLKNNFVEQLNNSTIRKPQHNVNLNLKQPKPTQQQQQFKSLNVSRKYTAPNSQNNTVNRRKKSAIGESARKKIQMTIRSHNQQQHQSYISVQKPMNSTMLYQQSRLNPNSIYIAQGQRDNDNLQRNRFHSTIMQRNTIESIQSKYRFQGDSTYIDRSRHNQSNKVDKKRKITQLFRYCFVCQQPILQDNLSEHQQQCQELKRLIYSTKEITESHLLKIMEDKIENIQNQIKQIFLCQSQSQIMNNMNSIHSNVKKWIEDIKNQNQSKVEIRKRKSLSEYSHIENQIKSSKILQSFQLFNKLNWFLHLKKNFELALRNSQMTTENKQSTK